MTTIERICTAPDFPQISTLYIYNIYIYTHAGLHRGGNSPSGLVPLSSPWFILGHFYYNYDDLWSEIALTFFRGSMPPDSLVWRMRHSGMEEGFTPPPIVMIYQIICPWLNAALTWDPCMQKGWAPYYFTVWWKHYILWFSWVSFAQMCMVLAVEQVQALNMMYKSYII